MARFIINDNYNFSDYDYFGGLSRDHHQQTSLRTLEQTCADDPFHKRCAYWYEAERDAIIDRCIIGGNANDESCALPRNGIIALLLRFHAVV